MPPVGIAQPASTEVRAVTFWIAEVAQLAGLVALARKNGDSFDEGICLAIERMLISPHSMFLIEMDQTARAAAAAQTVSDYELASRLSYFVWSSTPDVALLLLAGAQKLHRPEVLRAQVARMLRDPKLHRLADTPLANLYVAMAERNCVGCDSLGDSTGKLEI